MGVSGSTPREPEEDIWWTNGQKTMEQSTTQENPQSFVTETLCDVSLDQLSEKNTKELNDFKFEMDRKHEKRKEILAAKKKQFEDLREEVRKLTEENEKLKSEKSQEDLLKEIERLNKDNEHMRLLMSTKQSGGVLLEELDKVLRENANLKGELKEKAESLRKAAVLLDKNRELRISIAEMQKELQSLNGVVVEFENEREEYKAHVTALKDVINVSKKMLLIRESQLKELRQKVESIEESLSGQEMNLLSQDLRLEYERQLQSIRNLRTLYEERQRTDHKEKEQLKKLLDETKKELEGEQNKNKEAEERIKELEDLNSQKYDEIKSLESNLGLTKAESRQYQAELTVINQLFSEVLLGFNSSQEIDLDKLTKHLEDNHALLQNIVSSEISAESSFALPKVLLDLVHQVHSKEEQKQARVEETCNENRLETIEEEAESQTIVDQINSVEEIVELLPKVWRVLIELLSHHKVPENVINEEPSSENLCYKTVQTPKGPSVVVSVSQTFIRLKDLILEKKSLEKETGHLKQLNTHLENRLQDQEKRLEMVSQELNKTWHVVGKLQKEHQLLHTQEKILRYELAQKRKLLSTLREELEYSRGKWQEAREKNSKTEKQWRQLRLEFASRRNTLVSDDLNNSQESGYSDDRCSSSDDEPGYETDVSECAPAKQNEHVVVDEDNDCDNSNPVTPVPAADDSLQTRVSSTEEAIEKQAVRLNTRQNSEEVEAKKNDFASQNVQDTSLYLVSSVINDAISSILADKSSSSSDTSKTDEPIPSTSSKEPKVRTLEEILASKEERLRRLEGQCGQLMEQVTSTTKKSVVISNKLDDLHEIYGDRSDNQSTSVETSNESTLSLDDDVFDDENGSSRT